MATVVRLFETRDQTRRAIEALRAAGFRGEDLGLTMRERGEAAEIAAETGAEAVETGVVGGGLMGGIAGLLIGAGALAIPGIGPVVAAGPLAAALAGGAIGAVAGGLIGALVDLGVPEEEARDYQAGVRRGGILLTATVPDDRRAEAAAILDRAGTRDLDYHRRLWSDDPNYRYDIDRPSDPAAVTAEGMLGGTILGGAAGAVVGALAGGPPGAVIGAGIGGASGAGLGLAADYAAVEPEFRADWEASHRARTSWEAAAPAYQYGWNSYDPDKHRSRTFDDARSEIRTGWSEPTSWTDYEPMVRRGWERRSTLAAQGR